jgi:hypothetical protein
MHSIWWYRGKSTSTDGHVDSNQSMYILKWYHSAWYRITLLKLYVPFQGNLHLWGSNSWTRNVSPFMQSVWMFTTLSSGKGRGNQWLRLIHVLITCLTVSNWARVYAEIYNVQYCRAAWCFWSDVKTGANIGYYYSLGLKSHLIVLGFNIAMNALQNEKSIDI